MKKNFAVKFDKIKFSSFFSAFSKRTKGHFTDIMLLKWQTFMKIEEMKLNLFNEKGKGLNIVFSQSLVRL